jgi:hypothetical protein
MKGEDLHQRLKSLKSFIALSNKSGSRKHNGLRRKVLGRILWTRVMVLNYAEQMTVTREPPGDQYGI